MSALRLFCERLETPRFAAAIRSPGAAPLAVIALALAACSSKEEAPPAPAAPSSSAAGVAEVRPETRKFRDWLAVCDNGGACVALAPSLQEGAGWLQIRLAAGPGATPEILAGTVGQGGDAADDAPTLVIDSRSYLAERAQTSSVEGGDLAVIRDQPLAVIDAIASGRRLVVTTGPGQVPISLSGAAAALLWIDERQGRLSTTTALVRRGARPASAVPAAPVLPRLRPAAAVGQDDLPDPLLPAAFEARSDVRQCRADTSFNPDLQRRVTVDRLSADQELWGVPCFIGAYNAGYRYFVTAPGGADARPLSFPTSREPSAEVVNGEYDPGNRTLTAFNKGRGVGDCGIASTWVWTGGAFALKSETEMRECWGVPADHWPATWRSQ